MQLERQCHAAFASPNWWLWGALILPINVGYSLDAQAKTIIQNNFSSRSSHSGGTSQASISGRNGSMNVNGDDVEVHDGIVTVNGIPYGTVPSGATVRYVVAGDKKALYVDDEVRQPLKGNR